MELQPLRPIPPCDFPIEFSDTLAPSPQAALNDFLRKEMDLLGIRHDAVAADLSKFKTPLDKPPYWAPAKPIKKAGLSMFLHGHDRWPRHRLAGVFCLIELRFFQIMAQRVAPSAFSGHMGKLLALAKEHHSVVMGESDLQPLLLAYRASILQRLMKDRKKSEAHGKLYAEYRAAMPREVLDMIAQQRGQ